MFDRSPCAAAAAFVFLFFGLAARAQEEPPRHVFLEGHESNAYGLALTPDGRNPIAGAEDGTIRVWDRETGEVLRTLPGHTGTVTALATSPDGYAFASAGIDGKVLLFDVPRRHAMRKFAGVPEPPTSIAVAPDGSLVAVGHEANRVRLWNGETGQYVRDLPGVSSPIRDVVWVGETTVVDVEESGRLQGWNAADGASLGIVETAPSRAVAFDAEETRAALAGDDGLVRIVAWPPVPPTQLHTHGDVVTAIAISPDGKLAASGGNDSLVNVIDLATGKVAFTPDGQPGRVTSIDFSPDGKHLASGGETGSIKLWTTADESAVALLHGHEGPVRSVRFHPMDGTLATAGDDGTVRLWRIPDPMQPWSGHDQAVVALARSSDGNTIVSASGDKSVRLWDTDTGESKKTLVEHAAGLSAVAIDSKGTRVVSGDTGGIVKWLALEGDETAVEWPAHTGGVTGVGFGTDSHVWTSGGDGFVRLWDPSKPIEAGAEDEKTATPLAAVQADAAKVHALVVLADGSRFLTAGEDRHVKLWSHSGTTAEEVRRFGPGPAPVAQLAFSADESLVAAGGDPLFQQKSVLVWEIATGKALPKIDTPAGVTSVAFGPQGLLVIGGADKRIRLYDASSGRLRETIDVPAVPADVVNADETAVLVAASDGKLYRVDTAARAVFAGHEGSVTSLAWSANGDELTSGGADKTLRRWNVAGGEQSGEFKGNPASVVSMTTTPDGSRLVLGGSDNHIRIWSTDDPARVQLDVPQPAGVLNVAATDDRFVVAGTDNRIHVWHLETGKPLEQLVGHGSAVSAVATREGLVLSGSHDRSVRRWTPSITAALAIGSTPIANVVWGVNGESLFVATEKRVENWSVEKAERTDSFNAPAPVASIAFDRESNRLAAGSADGHVTVWNADNEKPIATAKLAGPVQSVSFSHDGVNVVAAVGNAVENLALVPGEGEAIALERVHDGIGPEQPVTAIAWAGRANLLFGVSEDRTVQAWTVARPGPRATLTGFDAPVHSLAFAPDSAVLAAGGADGRVRFWNVRDGGAVRKPMGQLDDRESGVTAITFATNGLFATAGGDASIRLWNPDAGLAVNLQSSGEKPDRWRSLAFSPNGAALVAAGRSGSWQHWSTETAESVRTGIGHNGPISSVAFNNAGNRFSTVDATGMLVVWNADNGGPLFHERLPFEDARNVQYLPDGTGVIVTGRDPRPLIVTLPAGAR